MFNNINRLRKNNTIHIATPFEIECVDRSTENEIKFYGWMWM